MALHNSRAIVLRSIKLSETDKLVTFLTERFGKIKCAAKSARKIKSRFGAGLEPLSFIQLIYFGKENQDICRLNHCDIIQSFNSVREDPRKVYTALYFSELVDSLTADGQGRPELFHFMLEALEGLRSGLDPDILCRLFEIRILSLQGYGPSLDHCILCRKAPNGGDVGYSFHRHGPICRPCGQRQRPELWVKAGAMNYVKWLTTGTVAQTGRIKIPKNLEKEVEILTHRMVQHQIGREPRSYPFIRKMAELMPPSPIKEKVPL